MRNAPLVGCLLIFAGSFLPLVHIPVVGNWNYWKLDHNMAIIVWSVAALALVSIIFNKVKLQRILAIVLLALFIITLFAIKAKSLNFLVLFLLKDYKTLLPVLLSYPGDGFWSFPVQRLCYSLKKIK